MNGKYLKFLAPLLICAAGCATNTRVTSLEQVGPNPTLTSQNAGTGSLQVFSARERVPIDVNGEEFFWNNAYGRNEFLHYPAHTSYDLYGPDGRLLQQVRNARGMNDADPAVVKLSPGVYRIEAAAEDYDDATLKVTVPVLIEPGLTTKVHLDGNWNPAVPPKKSSELCPVPNGHFVGWHPPKPDGSISPSGSNS